jgi:hypothetical protein
MRSRRAVGQRHVGDQGYLKDHDQDQQENAHGGSPEFTAYFYHPAGCNAVSCVTRIQEILA